jgi:hypothetical protein
VNGHAWEAFMAKVPSLWTKGLSDQETNRRWGLQDKVRQGFCGLEFQHLYLCQSLCHQRQHIRNASTAWLVLEPGKAMALAEN